MANINLPPPPPLQFVQADGKTVAWNWQDWFYKLQALAASVNTTPNTLVMPVEFTVTGNNTPTLTVAKANEVANTIWAGPTSGGMAQPVFRAMVTADLPASIVGSQTANTFYAAPNGSSGTPTFRRIAPQDYEWAPVKKSVASGETFNLPSGYEMTVHKTFTVSGVVNLNGQLYVE